MNVAAFIVVLLAQITAPPGSASLSIQDMAALTVILGSMSGLIFWVGSKFFATRKDFHALNNKITSLTIAHELTALDIKWIKAKMAGDNFPP